MGDNVNAAFVEKKSRKSYSLEKKLQCIAAAKRLNNIDKPAELEGVPRSCLVRWMSDEKEYKDARFQALYDQWMLDGMHETTAAWNQKPPPELYLKWVLEAWYDGVTKDNVINSFKACGIGAIGGAGDHLIHCLKEGNGIPNGLYDLTKAREAAEAQELAEILAGTEIDAADEDDTGHVNDVEVVDDESAASDDENSGSEDENHNQSDDSEEY